MNSKLQEFCEQNGMSVSGNKAYGVVRGYEANFRIVSNDMTYPYRWHISVYGTEDQKLKIKAAIDNAALKRLEVKFDDTGIWLLTNDFTAGALAKRLPEIFDVVVNAITENGGTDSNHCPYCGAPLDDENSSKKTINGVTVRIENSCVEKINLEIDEYNSSLKNAANNYLRGFLGALIGGVAGLVVSIILYFIGLMSAFSAIIAVMLGAFLYIKFGGKPNIMMVVIVAATTLVFMVASTFIVYLMASAQVGAESGLDISAFELFAFCMENAEFSNMFYTDLVVSIILSLVGSVIGVYAISKNVKRSKGKIK